VIGFASPSIVKPLGRRQKLAFRYDRVSFMACVRIFHRKHQIARHLFAVHGGTAPRKCSTHSNARPQLSSVWILLHTSLTLLKKHVIKSAIEALASAMELYIGHSTANVCTMHSMQHVLFPVVSSEVMYAHPSASFSKPHCTCLAKRDKYTSLRVSRPFAHNRLDYMGMIK
jgi:hypothetical protein